jgi:hypothetical protein
VVDHQQTSGHLPSEGFGRQIPGQPSAVSRFCGKCGAALERETAQFFSAISSAGSCGCSHTMNVFLNETSVSITSRK